MIVPNCHKDMNWRPLRPLGYVSFRNKHSKRKQSMLAAWFCYIKRKPQAISGTRLTVSDIWTGATSLQKIFLWPNVEVPVPTLCCKVRNTFWNHQIILKQFSKKFDAYHSYYKERGRVSITFTYSNVHAYFIYDISYQRIIWNMLYSIKIFSKLFCRLKNSR